MSTSSSARRIRSSPIPVPHTADSDTGVRPRRRHGGPGSDFEQIEHLVSDGEPDTALCGVDQTGVAWNLGWPVCLACLAVADGRMS